MTPEEGRALLAKASAPPWFIAERPLRNGLLRIEDGRAHGMYPVAGERFEIELIVWLVNNAEALLSAQEKLAKTVELVRRARDLSSETAWTATPETERERRSLALRDDCRDFLAEIDNSLATEERT